MKTAAEDLLHEHQAIEVALSLLEKMQEKAINNDQPDPGEILELLGFLKAFADDCHHGKEEKFLLPALEKAGMQNEGGPIERILAEHRQGRALIKRMEDSIRHNPVKMEDFVQAAIAYIKLLKEHIDKENRLLFPTISTMLSESEQQQLASDFEEFEEQEIGNGRHEELHALLKKFSKKYLN